MPITDRFKIYFENFKNLSTNRKIAFAAVAVISIAIIITFLLWLPKQDYQVLFSNLSAEDAGNVITKLKEKKVPYQVKDNAIYVPSDKVHELRLELAAQGVPSGGGVGFEIFDKTSIGLTEFSQRVNYIRALQGELARTIKQIQEVDQVRVHIAIPEKTIFTEKEDHPTASVVLKLKPGRTLSKEQVAGIVHLVSSSVEGLAPQYVTVVDQYGNLLSAPKDTAQLVQTEQIEYKKNIEKTYEKNIQSMLENIVGKGKAIVRVSTEIDFSKVERLEEKFDPDTIAIKSEQRSQEKTMAPQTGGIPGVLSNQPGQPQTGTTQNIQSQRQQESINYEVSKSISKILQATGQIKKISVAVLVDGVYKEEKGKKIYTPRSEEEIKKYQELVQAAIGYNKERGDIVIVESMPFEVIPEEKPAIDYLGIAKTILKYLLPIIVLLLIIFFIIKPLLEILKRPVEEKVKMKEVVISEEIPGMPPFKERDIKEEIRELAKSNPKKVVSMLREWMAE
ncbi:MAG: flagellar basal-body MS-ring/collar protein FliF [Thermodesulfovibrio sp.]|uniref:flagellar basal-body MS-ring/collar protein FliF n=1 Tax=unclassified Thermodesulfovibrio TaxID=2645936 RepID=UPI00083A0F71|nr:MULTISPECIES: flagellar basal-body MS-ring/collar protein FliF [unclassified Thermodesulfovibrio]MDI1470936.1 flagellar basal-body MS-ring/collar protein FliF [Thermodesulfovibrio sp. 1176]MDI6713786.1 flagellar basal-body MS-ring/collar protein FliF [Thermodesulfovibrio sp.]ODA45142.1 Flagellar M-ring protein FliF [Thermodesulfovibrio sp. N1]